MRDLEGARQRARQRRLAQGLPPVPCLDAAAVRVLASLVHPGRRLTDQPGREVPDGLIQRQRSRAEEREARAL